MKIAIYGYGNLGRGVECALRQNPDMELKAVFTRRNPETVNILTENAKVLHIDEAKNYKVCLQYHIKKCAGCCEGLQSREEYDENIEKIKSILKGEIGEIEDELKKENKNERLD